MGGEFEAAVLLMTGASLMLVMCLLLIPKSSRGYSGTILLLSSFCGIAGAIIVSSSSMLDAVGYFLMTFALASLPITAITGGVWLIRKKSLPHHSSGTG